MRAAAVILIVLAIIVVIASITLSLILATRTTTTSTGSSATVQPCSSSVPPSQLRSITGLPCCQVSGVVTNYRYDRDLDLVLAPFPTSYIEVCAGYCGGTFSNDICVGAGSTATADCITRIKPNGCEGQARPVAIDGTTLYYGYRAGDNVCDNCCTCGFQSCNASLCK